MTPALAFMPLKSVLCRCTQPSTKSVVSRGAPLNTAAAETRRPCTFVVPTKPEPP